MINCKEVVDTHYVYLIKQSHDRYSTPSNVDIVKANRKYGRKKKY